MNYILFDDTSRDNLLPLTYTRPVSEIRVGILTITEKWEKYLNTHCSFLTADYLSGKYKCLQEGDNILINGSVLPTQTLCNELHKLQQGEILLKEDQCIAARLSPGKIEAFKHGRIDGLRQKSIDILYDRIEYPWDIFQKNDKAIRDDFSLIIHGRQSQPLSSSNQVQAPENIFLEEGAKVESAILNAGTGPIYIGKDAEIMEGAMIRGPLAMCEHAGIKMGAKIYGATTLGPHCKAGGEVNNSVLTGYSNKAHDGFLGNSVLGEWCNLGADTNNSNLKNNYAEVKVWNYPKESFIKTGLQFCGLIMGDHSKSGINTMFNTGTVVGVSANIFGAGFPRNFIPSFSFGGNQGFMVYKLEKTFEVADLVMKRRNMTFSDEDKRIFSYIFSATQKFRNF